MEAMEKMTRKLEVRCLRKHITDVCTGASRCLSIFFNYFSDFEYDFDVMMRKRKAENSKARRKRKDIDVINDSDELIQFLCEQMKEAARVSRSVGFIPALQSCQNSHI